MIQRFAVSNVHLCGIIHCINICGRNVHLMHFSNVCVGSSVVLAILAEIFVFVIFAFEIFSDIYDFNAAHIYFFLSVYDRNDYRKKLRSKDE